MNVFNHTLERLKKEEGAVKESLTGLHIPYKDPDGYMTIGYGILIDPDKRGGLTDKEADLLLSMRLVQIEVEVENLFQKTWHAIGNYRQIALLDMAYNMGTPALSRFKKMIAAIEDEDYERAADEILDSKYARDDVPARAKRNAEMMRNNVEA